MRGFLGINLDRYRDSFREIDLSVEGMHHVKEHHLRLIFFKDISEDDVKRIGAFFSIKRFNPFELVADAIYAFPNLASPHLYGLGFKETSGLKNIRNAVIDSLGLVPDDNPTFHVTLLRKEKLTPVFEQGAEVYRRIKPRKILVDSVGFYKSEPEKGLNVYTPIFVKEL